MRRNLIATSAVAAVLIGVLTPVQSLAGPTALPGKTQGNGPCATSGNANSQIQSTKNNKKDCLTLAAPAFTLSASSETRTVNTLATGFTVASTGGLISSFAISPSAPSGMSFNTTTGAFSGTPTSVSATINYTITATNATGSTTRTFSFTVTAAPLATYSATKFMEAAANDGSINEVITITLSAESIFTYYSGTNLAFGRVANVPYGLTAALTVGTDRTYATLTFTGTATAHANANDISNLTITFLNEDFTPNGVPSGANRSDLSIDFSNPYNIGDVGPGGGKIFYYDEAGFNCGSSFSATGSPRDGKCHYLEVAPNGWSGAADDPRMAWAINTFTYTSIPGANETAIGGGFKNSAAIVNAIGGSYESFAAGLARGYQNTSGKEWYLPSIDELVQLQLNQVAVGLSSFSFWSSTEYDASSAKDLGGYSSPGNGDKATTTPVRPIRAF